MKKKRKCFEAFIEYIIILLGMLALSACGGEGGSKEGVKDGWISSFVGGEANKHAEDTPWNHGMHAMMETENGYYSSLTTSNYQQRLCLRYYDKETGTTMLLCNKPECQHEGDEACEATYKGIRVINTALYEGAIYVLGAETWEGTTGIYLYKAALDGSSIDKVGTVLSAPLPIDESGNPQEVILKEADAYDEIFQDADYSFILHKGQAYIPYYLSTITEGWLVNPRVCLLAWRQFIDTESCRKEWAKLNRLHGINYSVTGLPFMDELMLPKTEWQDVWPNMDNRKRIIYAPHHTIADIHMEGIGYSTFLDYHEYMLRLRDKYKEQVYFVFKPHPRLYPNLLTFWGKQKTEEYYRSWDLPGYSHVEDNDDYLALFKYSDALIHDCGSFTIEYLYMDNPVMYLTHDAHHADNLNGVAHRAFDRRLLLIVPIDSQDEKTP